jgi:hypothetical protein
MSRRFRGGRCVRACSAAWICWAAVGLFRSKVSFEAEKLVLRHQLNVLRRKSPKRLAFRTFDRLVFARLNGIAPRVVSAQCPVRS